MGRQIIQTHLDSSVLVEHYLILSNKCPAEIDVNGAFVKNHRVFVGPQNEVPGARQGKSPFSAAHLIPRKTHVTGHKEHGLVTVGQFASNFRHHRGNERQVEQARNLACKRAAALHVRRRRLVTEIRRV